MKRYNYTILLATVLLLGACGEDFLDLKPETDVVLEGFFENAEEVNLGVISVYDGLQGGENGNDEAGGNVRTLYKMVVLRADNGENTAFNGDQFDGFYQQNNDGDIDNFWDGAYNVISRANLVLDQIKAMNNLREEEQALIRQYEGELKFLRAYNYFNLVRIFGDVPLITETIPNVEESYNLLRTSADQVYGQIITDLQEAIQQLPLRSDYNADQLGRATRGAAQSLLAKVYLTRQDFAGASAQLAEVISSGEYALETEYASNFALNSEENIESVFVVPFNFSGGDDGNDMHRWTPQELTDAFTFGANGWVRPTTDIAEAYFAENDSVRYIVAMDSGAYELEADTVFLPFPYIKKYIQQGATGFGNTDVNVPVIRYADVLLMQAEALNEQSYVADGEAFNLLNQVRERAMLLPLTSAAVPDQQAFRRAVEEERRLELSFEGHRWFDLIRTGRVLEVMNAHGSDPATGNQFQITETDLLFPVPQNEIDKNPDITQNPGY